VTQQDVTKAAQEVLHPDQMMFLIVGDWETIQKGDADGKATMSDFFDGKVTRLPQRDPVTLAPLSDQ
jgi:hypothetical protein